ncbi:uncharacterized protein [Clytia hemisphaerica]|uniref:Poly [ADP-ribose] polymerase 12 n=1 Tax=Clytia hemisphaerica TaxID=252671 RepID=A0A7M5V3X8_9CNID
MMASKPSELFKSKDGAYVHKWVSHNKLLKADIKFLTKHLRGYDDILETIQDDKKMFWVAQITDDNYEVRPKVPVDICKTYNETKQCGYRFCNKMHLCKRYLWSPKSCVNQNCGQVHSINTNHNKSILDKIFPDGYSDEIRMKVLRSSFPRLCLNFLKDVSCSQPFCGYFHICEDFVNDSCGRTCKLATQSGKPKTTMHNFVLYHNKLVFSIFFPDERSVCREEAAINILMAPKAEKNKNESGDNTSAPTKGSRNLKAFPSSMELSTKEKPSPKRLSSAASVPNLAYTTTANIGSPVAQLNVKICRFYLGRRCRNKSCPYLHLCKAFLLEEKLCPGECRFKLSHDPLDAHNQSIIKRLNSTLHNKQIIKALRKSFPRVCPFYQNKKCTKNCMKLHVCLNFLQNSVCTLDGCDLSHDVFDDYNQAILDSHGSKFHDIDKNAITANILFPKGKKDATTDHVRGAAKVDTSITDWYDRILKSPDGFEDLGANPETDVIVYFKSSEHFRLVQHKGQNSVYVCPKDVKPCTQYWRKNNLCKHGKDCSKFHICKKFIFNENGCLDKNCASQHDFNNGHEQSLIQKHNLESFSEEQLKALLKYRYPIVCIPYLKRACKSPSTCPNVHICKRFLQNQCKQDGRTCKWAHEVGLRNSHSQRVMEEFYLKENNFRECIMLPKPRDRPKKIKGVFELDEEKPEQSSEDESGEEFDSESETCQGVPDLKPKKTKGFTGFDSSAKLESGWEAPSEMDVFTFIIQYPYYGQIPLGSIQLMEAFFKGHEDECLKWFKDHSTTFRLDRSRNVVFLCVKNIRSCLDYWSESGCILGDCGSFHICKESLFDSKTEHSAISCGKHHDFSSAHNKGIIGKFSLEPLKTRQLKCLLKNTLPSVCEEYLENRCTDLQQCENIHICGDFVNGECRKHSALCSFRHEEALTDNHADEIMKLFHISDTLLLKKSLVYFKPKSEEKKKQEFLQQPTFNFLKDEAICVKYLDDVCDNDETCSLLHPKNHTPYLWQYKKPNETSWKSFPINLNVEIEKAFCDPMQSRYETSSDKMSFIEFANDGKMSGSHLNQSIEIRRLSTASKALQLETCKDSYYTEWKWYWKENCGNWTEYVEKNSLYFEKNYHSEIAAGVRFTAGQYKYELMFKTMQQQNLNPKYFTKRDVIRRPVYKSSVDESSTPQEEDNTPWHWPKEVSFEGGRLDVEPTKKKQISQQFKASLGKNVTVLDVEEICNAEFYQKYQSKKKILTKKLGENDLNELELYHGTDAAVVDGICKQNFDWRLNGKNATAFGQGSYFAKEASYSLTYTRPDSNKLRYMFLAKVLAGRSTRGDRTLKRPPPISPSDPHTLYDSCVNSISSPSMYIVFERDQCYPQYLITFLLDEENYCLAPNQSEPSLTERCLQRYVVEELKNSKKIQPLLQRPPKPKKRPDIGPRSSSSGNADNDCVIS